MTLPAEPPKLPKWPFLVGDGALVAVAWIIAHQSPATLPPIPLIAVVACVVVGAVLATYPFVIEYTRAQEIALDDRQRALETLSVTVATSSEQISIAANGLHEITELAQRNLKAAEQLPAKIHERLTAIIGGFQDSRADDREELQRELATLRAAQTDKLADITDSIARSVSDLATLHSTAQRQISASAEAITRASASFAPFDAQMSATLQRAEKVFSSVPHPPLENRRGHAVNLPDETAFLNDSVASPHHTFIEPASDVATAAPITAEASEFTSPRVGTTPPTGTPDAAGSNPPQTEQELISADPFTAAMMSVLEPTKANPAPSRPKVLAAPEPAPIPSQTIEEIVPVAPRDSASMSPMLLPSDTTKLRPERKRSPRKPKVTTPPMETDTTSAPAVADMSVVPSDNNSGSSTTLVDREPPPVEPVPTPIVVSPPESLATDPVQPEMDVAATPVADAPVPAPHEEKPAEPAPVLTPTAIEPEEPTAEEVKPLQPEPAPSSENSEPAELSLSSDGATRLLVTAYIGIGNRLFIRGDGAGLNWEKGVPLQFISIGKWRWETHETTSPIAFKLYKNDSIECAELDVTAMEPGRQHEVVAKF